MSDNIAELSTRLRSVASEITALNKQVKELKEKRFDIEASILATFEEIGHGMTSISTDAGTVSIRETLVANVDDWDAFYEWIYQTKSGHLLERRVANIAFREMNELGEHIPGLEPFMKKSVSLTKGKSKT